MIIHESWILICDKSTSIAGYDCLGRSKTKNNFFLQKLQDLIRLILVKVLSYWQPGYIFNCNEKAPLSGWAKKKEFRII